MKKYILFFVCAFAIVKAQAQSGFNYYEFGVGAGVSYGRAFADLKKENYHPAVNLNVAYNYSPFLPITLQVDKGVFSGGGRTKDLDASGRIYSNSYLSLNLHIDLQAGEIIDYQDSQFLNAVKNFYVGTGLGFVKNHMTDIQRTNLIIENGPIGVTGGLEGKTNSINLMVPLRIGYEFKIFDDYDQPRYAINIGYQHIYTFSEGLDGYNDDPSLFKNNALDQYAQVTIGFKYNFGNTTAYTKLIRNFR